MQPFRLLAPLGALLLTATSVVYGPVPESVFAPPEGFCKLDIAVSAGAVRR